MKIELPASALRRLSNTEFIEIRIEEAIGCDGSTCGRSACDASGESRELPLHYHMVVTGRVNLESGPRCYAIGGELPELIFEPSRE
jgi:hypothetical protein